MGKKTDKIIREVVTLLNSHFTNAHATSKKLKHWCRGEGYIKTICKDGKVAAYAVVSAGNDECRLEYIGVKKEYRQEGLGRELLDAVITHARERGWSLDTYVSVNNIPSINMCISCGLKIYRITSSWVFFELD